MNSLEPEDICVFTHLLWTTYRGVAASIAVNKTNTSPALMGLNPNGDLRQIMSKLNK